MTQPKFIEKGQMCFVTCGAVGQSFRFVPNTCVVRLIWFVFALLASARGLAVHEVFFMSNHFHVLLTDVDGRLPDFMRDMNSLLSRGLNALRGVTGTNIEKGYNLVTPSDDHKVVEHAVYSLLNACAAGLVERAREWTGVSSLKLDYGQTITLSRPPAGLWKSFADDFVAMEREHRRKHGDSRGRARRARRIKTPESVDFTLVRPPVCLELSDAQLRAHIRQQVQAGERKYKRERTAQRRGVLGMARVRIQSWTDTPTTTRVLFNTIPRVSGKSKQARLANLSRRLEFELDYAEARDQLTRQLRTASLPGKTRSQRINDIAAIGNIVFPHGTYLLCRRYGLPCHPPP